jgi:hypothetical protein
MKERKKKTKRRRAILETEARKRKGITILTCFPSLLFA